MGIFDEDKLIDDALSSQAKKYKIYNCDDFFKGTI